MRDKLRSRTPGRLVQNKRESARGRLDVPSLDRSRWRNPLDDKSGGLEQFQDRFPGKKPQMCSVQQTRMAVPPLPKKHERQDDLKISCVWYAGYDATLIFDNSFYFI